MMHLSRMSEADHLVVCAVHFITLSDSFCTGSSIMPQKKNPDVPELRAANPAACSVTWWHLLTLMKSQPLAYNKDNQEDKGTSVRRGGQRQGLAEGVCRHDRQSPATATQCAGRQ